MIYKNGEQSRVGDIIRWKFWDSDDFITWTFTGLVSRYGVVYLGGGIDFGRGIGTLKSYDEVISESENNDYDENGIEKVGNASDLADHISIFGDTGIGDT